MMKSLVTGALAVAACSVASPTLAQDLVHQPISPTFGGNPFNSSHILGTANAQNKTSATKTIPSYVT